MDQEEIKRLLHAASYADCCREQRQEILQLFLQAIAIDARRHDKSGERDRFIIEKLFWETAENLPALFPFLFPVFAQLCGQRTAKGFAKIDWAAMRNGNKLLGG